MLNASNFGDYPGVIHETVTHRDAFMAFIAGIQPES